MPMALVLQIKALPMKDTRNGLGTVGEEHGQRTKNKKKGIWSSSKANSKWKREANKIGRRVRNSRGTKEAVNEQVNTQRLVFWKLSKDLETHHDIYNE